RPARPGLPGMLQCPTRLLLGHLGPEQQAHRSEGDGVDASRLQKPPGEDQRLPELPWNRDAHRVVFGGLVEELIELGIGLQIVEELPHQHLKRARITIRGKGTRHTCSPCWPPNLRSRAPLAGPLTLTVLPGRDPGPLGKYRRGFSGGKADRLDAPLPVWYGREAPSRRR